MYHILIPIDENEARTTQAVKGATELAANGCAVKATLLNVFREFEVTEGESRVSSSKLYDPKDFPETAVQARKRLTDSDIETDIRREHGDPAEWIVTIAREIDADVIMMGGRKRSAIRKALLGSTTQQVLLNTDRPVTVCPPN